MRNTNKGVNEDSIYSCNLHVHNNLTNLTNHPVNKFTQDDFDYASCPN